MSPPPGWWAGRVGDKIFLTSPNDFAPCRSGRWLRWNLFSRRAVLQVLKEFPLVPSLLDLTQVDASLFWVVLWNIFLRPTSHLLPLPFICHQCRAPRSTKQAVPHGWPSDAHCVHFSPWQIPVSITQHHTYGCVTGVRSQSTMVLALPGQT